MDQKANEHNHSALDPIHKKSANQDHGSATSLGGPLSKFDM